VVRASTGHISCDPGATLTAYPAHPCQSINTSHHWQTHLGDMLAYTSWQQPAYVYLAAAGGGGLDGGMAAEEGLDSPLGLDPAPSMGHARHKHAQVG
jgi:hypothetical protein